MREIPYRVSAVPRRHHHLAVFEQQEVRAALPATVDLLDERGEVLQAVAAPFLQEEELESKGILVSSVSMCPDQPPYYEKCAMKCVMNII